MIDSPAELAAAIERTCRSRYRTHPLLEDAIQEGLIEAWSRIDAEEGYGYVLQAALWRAGDIIAGKQALGAPQRSPGSGSRIPAHVSREALESAQFAPDLDADLDMGVDPIAEAERVVFVEEVLMLLEPVERFIVESMMAGYAHADIAEALDRSVAAVRKRMPKIRAKLEPALEDLRAS